jgi:hypothetical protein
MGTKTEETVNFIDSSVRQKVDKIAENRIVWTERTPAYSSTITHQYVTLNGSSLCNERVEKQGRDAEGTWNEVWGTEFEADGDIVTTYSVKEGERFES